MATIVIGARRYEMAYDQRGQIYDYVDITLLAPIGMVRTVANHWSWQRRIA